MSLPCGSCVQDFATKWCAGISQLCAAHYPLVIHEVIEAILIKLPASIPFQMLQCETMHGIDSIGDNNIMTFICITNETLDIDSHHRPTVSTT